MRKLLASLLLNKKDINNKEKEFLITDFYSKKQINDYQNQKLRNLIVHAYENVPYYTKLFEKHNLLPKDIQTKDDLYKIPLLKKSDIQNNYSDLISKKLGSFYKKTTSGSTGKPLTILSDATNKSTEIALFYRFNNLIGNNNDGKFLLLWGEHSSGLLEKCKLILKQFIYNYKLEDTYSLDKSKLDKLAFKVHKGTYPNLRGFTTSVYLLAKHMESKGLFANLNSISVSAEQLFDSQRNVIESQMGKNIYNQYGCGEINSLAFECSSHNGMHHAFEHSILEIIDENGSNSSSGNVVITNLDNFSMPLIRYENGDIATISAQNCTCGRKSQLIDKIEGRTYDFIKGLNGEIVHGGFLDQVLLDTSFTKNYDIKALRIIQTDLDRIKIEYESNDIVSDESKDEVIKSYQNSLGLMKISFENVDRIQPSKSGKRKFVISYKEYLKW